MGHKSNMLTLLIKGARVERMYGDTNDVSLLNTIAKYCVEASGIPGLSKLRVALYLRDQLHVLDNSSNAHSAHSALTAIFFPDETMHRQISQEWRCERLNAFVSPVSAMSQECSE